MKLTSFEPFWLIKNGIIESYPSLKKDLQTDILIIGGGITGSLMAHQCIADGYDTTLIDKREIAHGSTSATTSMLQYEIDVPLHQLIEMIGEQGAVMSYKACSGAIDTLKEIVDQVQSTSGYQRKKSLYFAHNRKEARGLKKEFELRQKHGFNVKWVTAEEILRDYKIHHSFGGILSDQGASMDAFQFTHDVLKFNHKKGLKIFDKTEIKTTTYTDQGIQVLLEEGAIIKTKKIIYCTGYETKEIINESFVDLLNTYAMVGEQDEDLLSNVKDTLFWNTASPYCYIRTTDDNRLLIGGEDDHHRGLEKRNNKVENKAKKLKKQLIKYFPEQGFTTDFSWCGTFGVTKDGLPYIGEHKDFPNSLFVLGFGGNGITFSTIGMAIISKLLKGEPDTLAHYFRFGR